MDEKTLPLTNVKKKLIEGRQFLVGKIKNKNNTKNREEKKEKKERKEKNLKRKKTF